MMPRVDPEHATGVEPADQGRNLLPVAFGAPGRVGEVMEVHAGEIHRRVSGVLDIDPLAA